MSTIVNDVRAERVARGHRTEATDKSDAEALRAQILELTRAYHAAKWPAKEFVAGKSAAPVSGRVFDEDELATLVDSSLDFWLTTGRYAAEFEREFAQVMGVRYALLVNSGSSANLLAFTTLTDESLGEKHPDHALSVDQLARGDHRHRTG